MPDLDTLTSSQDFLIAVVAGGIGFMAAAVTSAFSHRWEAQRWLREARRISYGAVLAASRRRVENFESASDRQEAYRAFWTAYEEALLVASAEAEEHLDTLAALSADSSHDGSTPAWQDAQCSLRRLAKDELLVSGREAYWRSLVTSNVIVIALLLGELVGLYVAPTANTGVLFLVSIFMLLVGSRSASHVDAHNLSVLLSFAAFFPIGGALLLSTHEGMLAIELWMPWLGFAIMATSACTAIVLARRKADLPVPRLSASRRQ